MRRSFALDARESTPTVELFRRTHPTWRSRRRRRSRSARGAAASRSPRASPGAWRGTGFRADALPRSRGEPVDEPCAGPLRPHPRVQSLRGEARGVHEQEETVAGAATKLRSEGQTVMPPDFRSALDLPLARNESATLMPRMDLGLRKRVALVTGGSTGLGLAIARELACGGSERRHRGAEEGRARARGGGISKSRERGRFRSSAMYRCPARPSELRALRRNAWADRHPVANAGGPPSTLFDSTSDEHTSRRSSSTCSARFVWLEHVFPACARANGAAWFSYVHGREAAGPGADPLEHGARRTAGLRQDARHRVRARQRDREHRTSGPLRYRAGNRARADASRAREADCRRRVGGANDGIPLGRSGDPKEMAAVVAFLAVERASFVPARRFKWTAARYRR